MLKIFPKKSQPIQAVQPRVTAPLPSEPIQTVQESQAVTNPIFESLDSLQDALINLHPQLPTILQKILRNLKEHPATVTLLTDEQIAKILEGLKHVTNTEIMTTKMKGTKAKISVDDI